MNYMKTITIVSLATHVCRFGEYLGVDSKGAASNFHGVLDFSCVVQRLVIKHTAVKRSLHMALRTFHTSNKICLFNVFDIRISCSYTQLGRPHLASGLDRQLCIDSKQKHHLRPLLIW